MKNSVKKLATILTMALLLTSLNGCALPFGLGRPKSTPTPMPTPMNAQPRATHTPTPKPTATPTSTSTPTPTPGHVHDWKIGEKEEASCMREGKVVKYCECGAIEEEVIEKLPHTPGEPIVVEATLESEGSITIVCTVCGEVISVTETAKLTPSPIPTWTPTPTPEPVANVTVTGVKKPEGSIAQASFALAGTVSVDLGKFNDVTGSIIDQNGKVVQTITEKVNTFKFEISRSKINKDLIFNQLSAGNYTYSVTVTGTEFEGAKEIIRSEFTVLASTPTPTPTKTPTPKAKKTPTPKATNTPTPKVTSGYAPITTPTPIPEGYVTDYIYGVEPFYYPDEPNREYQRVALAMEEDGRHRWTPVTLNEKCVIDKDLLLRSDNTLLQYKYIADYIPGNFEITMRSSYIDVNNTRGIKAEFEDLCREYGVDKVTYQVLNKEESKAKGIVNTARQTAASIVITVIDNENMYSKMILYTAGDFKYYMRTEMVYTNDTLGKDDPDKMLSLCGRVPVDLYK